MKHNKTLSITRNIIPYIKELRPYTKSVTSSILMQQLEYWFEKQHYQAFYKFREPCEHKAYKIGDSWTEELGMSKDEFLNAFANIGISYKSKTDFLEKLKEGSPFSYINDNNQVAEKFYCYYFDRQELLTYYYRNHNLVNKTLEEIATFLESDKPALQKTINPVILESDKPALLYNRDYSTETTSNISSSSVSQNQEICNIKNVALQDCNTSKEYELSIYTDHADPRDHGQQEKSHKTQSGSQFLQNNTIREKEPNNDNENAIKPSLEANFFPRASSMPTPEIMASRKNRISIEELIITAYIRATFDACPDKLCCFAHIKNVIRGGSLVQDSDNFTIDHINENVEKWGFTQGSMNKRGAMDEASLINEVIGDKSYDEFYNAFYTIQSKRCQKDSPFYLANFASNELGVLKGLLKIDLKKPEQPTPQNKEFKKIKKQLDENVIIMQNKVKELLEAFPEAASNNSIKLQNEFYEVHCQKIIDFIAGNKKTPFDPEEINLIQENDCVLVRCYNPYITSPNIKSLIIQYFNNIGIDNVKFAIVSKINHASNIIKTPDKQIIQPIINEFLKEYDVLLHKDFVINEFINMHIAINGSSFADKKGRDEASVFLNMLEENNQRIGLNILINIISNAIINGQETRKIVSPIDIYNMAIANWTYFLNFV